jgi:hypothetical protein
MLRAAANVLGPVRDDVVVIGASAVRVALDGRDASVTPTRDIDAGTQTEAVERIVARLEQAGLKRSSEPHEHGFTWVRGTLKVQLIRPYHPFAKGAAAGLPVNNTISELQRHRVPVAFDDEPDTPRLWCADAAALVGLKGEAFGRTRHDGAPVDRDFADVVLLLDHLLDEIEAQVATDDVMRRRVIHAANKLLEDDATTAAIRQLTLAGSYDTAQQARQATQRAATRALRTLDRPAPPMSS